MNKKILMAVLTALVLRGGMEASAESPVRVVGTVGMVADIVRQVVGDKAEVTSLIGEGIDPHLYKPTRHDVLQLSQADMVFYNGLLLEGKMAETLSRLARKGRPVHAVAAMLVADELLASADDPRHHDPHIWMDVRLWSRGVALVADQLTAHYPDWQPEVSRNTDSFREKLARLHAYITEIMASVPEDRRVLITAHDAFHYFGRAYGLEVMGIQGISTESEAGLHDINRLVDVLVHRDIRAIFVETSVADRNVKALIEGARARGHSVTIGGSLFSDAMGATGTYEGTYVGMMEHNASTIARALGGTVPEGGFARWKEMKTP